MTLAIMQTDLTAKIQGFFIITLFLNYNITGTFGDLIHAV